MAILFLDGCDHLSTQNVITKYDLRENYTSGNVTVVTSVTRLGTTGAVYKFNTVSPRLGIEFSAVGVQSYIGMGMNYMYDGSTDNSTKITLMQILDTTSASVARISQEARGRWVLDLGSGNASVTSATAGVTTSIWDLIEFQVSYGASGRIQMYLSGTIVISYTGSVLTSAGTGMTRVFWGTGKTVAGKATYIDDFYVINNAGPQASALIGKNMRIRTHWPNGDTGTSAWTPDTGSTHYTQVDESSTPGAGHDGAATYVCTTSANARDLYDMENATGTYSANEIPLGVQIVAAARQTAGTPSLNLVTELSGTVLSHTTTSAVSSDWFFHRGVFMSAPGGASWVVSRLDALTIGQEMA